jgi:hypothetical protein
MDLIRERVLRRLKELEPAPEPGLKPHPAISEFLAQMGRNQ